MRHLGLGTLRLADPSEQFFEPWLVDVEGLAALDAGELDGAQGVAPILVMADHPAFAAKRDRPSPDS